MLVPSARRLSRLKGRVIRVVRSARSALPEALGGGVPTWAPESVPTATGTERDVEIPWVASAVTTCLGLWLDVGYAHAEPRYWDAIAPRTWRRHLRYGYGLDVAPPTGTDPLPAHVVGDVAGFDFRRLPPFDLITCISTLEHIGCDNTRYVSGFVRGAAPFKQQEQALTHLVSALTRRGRLLVTVPYGVFEDHGWFLQYDAASVRRLSTVAEEAGGTLRTQRYYRLAPGGWERVRPEPLSECTYRDAEWRASAVALLEFGR
jgi:hypothetical protein